MFFNKYFDSPPYLCVRCYDRHIEKGNPCSWFLKSKYENKWNVSLVYSFDYTGSFPQDID